MDEKCCIICGRNGSAKWWKCCPKHTTEQGSDVCCDSCAKELHPKKKKTTVTNYCNHVECMPIRFVRMKDSDRWICRKSSKEIFKEMFEGDQ